MGCGVLQIFGGDALQIGRRLQQPLIERAQHAHGLFAARLEGFDLFPRRGALKRSVGSIKVLLRSVLRRWQCSSILGMA